MKAVGTERSGPGEREGLGVPDHTQSGQYPQLVQVAVKVGGIPKYPQRTCSRQRVFAAAAAELPSSAGSQQVPYGVTNHVAVLHFHAEALLAFQEQDRLRLGPRHVPGTDALDSSAKSFDSATRKGITK